MCSSYIQKVDERTDEKQRIHELKLKKKNMLKIFSKRKCLDSKLKEFANDYFEIGENGGKFSERLENTVWGEAKRINSSRQGVSYGGIFLPRDTR